MDKSDYTTSPNKQHYSSVSIKIIILCLAWYGVSSSTSQLSKAVLTQFRFPLMLGQLQFLSASVLCCLTTRILHSNKRLRKLFPRGSVPSRQALEEGGNKFVIMPTKQIISSTLPMGIFQFVGKFFSHAATSLVPVSTVSSIKTLSPLLVVLTYKLYYHVHFPISTYITLLPIAAGVWLIITSVNSTNVNPVTSNSTSFLSLDNDDLRGCIFAFISCFVFVVQNIYGKKVVTYNSSKMKNNPALLALASAEKHQQLLPLSNNNSNVSLDRFDEKQSLESEKLDHYIGLAASKPYQNHLTVGVGSTNTNPYSCEQYSTSNIALANNAPSSDAAEKPFKLDKLTILFYCSVLGSLFSLPAFLFSEFPKILTIISTNTKPKLLQSEGLIDVEPTLVTIPWCLLLLNGVSHFAQALISFHVLGQIPTVTYSIASLLKRIFIITISMLWTDHTVSFPQFLGLSLIGVGLYAYDKYGGGIDTKKPVVTGSPRMTNYNPAVGAGGSRSPSPKIMINNSKVEC